MYELALFAGAGGGLLATKWLLGWRTVCYVENAAYPVEVLKARIRDGLLDDAPIWDDARTFDGRSWRGCVDIVTAGFPCQPFSKAGKMLAGRDERNLWPDTIRIIREVRPEWCLLENVAALLSGSHGYFGQVLQDLAESGYDAFWRVLSAGEVGAPHKRDRIWIVAQLANAHSNGFDLASWREVDTDENRIKTQPKPDGGSQTVAHAQQTGGGAEHTRQCGMERQNDGIQSEREQGAGWAPICGATMADPDCQGCPIKGPVRSGQKHTVVEPSGHWRGWWQTEPRLGRVVDGVAHRVDRLRAISEGQVPAVVAGVWQLLSG
jgi:DNA (cytosine-5)-methyltransferase 1